MAPTQAERTQHHTRQTSAGAISGWEGGSLTVYLACCIETAKRYLGWIQKILMLSWRQRPVVTSARVAVTKCRCEPRWKRMKLFIQVRFIFTWAGIKKNQGFVGRAVYAESFCKKNNIFFEIPQLATFGDKQVANQFPVAAAPNDITSARLQCSYSTWVGFLFVQLEKLAMHHLSLSIFHHPQAAFVFRAWTRTLWLCQWCVFLPDTLNKRIFLCPMTLDEKLC